MILGQGTTDLGVRMEKIPGVVKRWLNVTTSLSDSWEAFTPPYAGRESFTLVGSSIL